MGPFPGPARDERREMKVTIFGSGYVGLVTGACLAETGNDVKCVDVDDERIAMLNRGEVPIYEPGLQDMVARNLAAGRLTFTTDAREGVKHGLFQLIAVGTPPDEDGSADLRYVLQVANTIGQFMDEYKLVVTKSTVPVGTAHKVKDAVADALASRGSDVEFDVASNPEFLKEGAAVSDFMKPDRIIIGTENAHTAELLHSLYEPFVRTGNPILTMDVASAELTKYAANAMLATKISFMNELACLAERYDADVEQIRVGIGSDPRIGYHFIYPGCGYGGSCFPKDVDALVRSAGEVGFDAKVVTAVAEANRRQRGVLFEKIDLHFDGDLAGRTIALWGLAFKPNTDDMREAPSRDLMEALWKAGASVRAYDPVASDEAKRIYGDRDDFTICHSALDAVEGADALAIATEWTEFRSPDFPTIADKMASPVIFDGRNIYDPASLAAKGFTYYAIGRGKPLYR